MKKSALQFKNPKIEYVLFELNKCFDEQSELSMQMRSEVNINKDTENREATITLTLEFDKDSCNLPFYLKIAASSDFRWRENLSFDIDKTLKVSGSTMLLSYLRPTIANLTMQAGLAPFHLPFFDLTSE